MVIIGCDYHPGFQQIAFVNTETGDLEERRLAHREEAQRFYSELKEKNLGVLLRALRLPRLGMSNLPRHPFSPAIAVEKRDDG